MAFLLGILPVASAVVYACVIAVVTLVDVPDVAAGAERPHQTASRDRLRAERERADRIAHEVSRRWVREAQPAFDLLEGIPPEIGEEVLSAASLMPRVYRQVLVRAGTRIKPFPEKLTDHPDGRHLRGRPIRRQRGRGTLYDDCWGVCMKDGAVLLVGMNPQGRLRVGTLLHECGHALDVHLAGSASAPISSRAEYREVFGRLLTSHQREEWESYYNEDYARCEAFAQQFSKYHTTRLSREALRRELPYVHDFFRRLESRVLADEYARVGREVAEEIHRSRPPRRSEVAAAAAGE